MEAMVSYPWVSQEVQSQEAGSSALLKWKHACLEGTLPGSSPAGLGLPFLDEHQWIQMATSLRDPTGFWVINSNASVDQMGAMDRRFWALWPTRDTKESHTLNGGSVLPDFSSFQEKLKIKTCKGNFLIFKC